MTTRKKILIVSSILIAILLSCGIFYYFLFGNNRMDIGQTYILKVGKSVKVNGTNLEIRLEGIWGCNEGPHSDQGFQKCIGYAKNPSYAYIVNGKEDHECEGPCFDDGGNIFVHGYKVKELERGEDWTKIEVTKQ
ncbi:MAG: hypothetical protein WAW80_01635 [Candidatus Saccharimonadales bacterium]